jgi:hypothetical protein
VLEYSCHEGNNFIRTALRAEQQYQQKVADARAKGEPIPERPKPRNTGGGIGIFAPPSESEAVEIGTGRIAARRANRAWAGGLERRRQRISEPWSSGLTHFGSWP